MKTSRLVRFWISCFSLSTSCALAADDDAGARGVDVDLQLVGGALDLDLRDAGVLEALLQVLLERQVLVQQVGVVLAREPARLPGLVEPDPEPVRVNFLTHCDLLVTTRPPRPGFLTRGCAAPVVLRRRPRPTALITWARSVTSTVRCVVRFTMRNARPIGAGRTRFCDGPVVGVARRDEQPLDVAAEAVLLLRVGHRRAQHLRHVAGHRLAAELQRRQRLVDVLAADQIAAPARPSGPRCARTSPLPLREPWLSAFPAGAAGAPGARRACRRLVGAGRVALELARRRELAELVARPCSR